MRGLTPITVHDTFIDLAYAEWVDTKRRQWPGGEWGVNFQVDDQMLAEIPEPELVRMVEKYADRAHAEMLKAAAEAGVPEEGLRCEHTTHQGDEDGLGRTRFAMTCRTPAVEWVEKSADWTERPHSMGKSAAEALPQWCVVGRPTLGRFASEGEALAKAWSVTPAGGRRPEVGKR